MLTEDGLLSNGSETESALHLTVAVAQIGATQDLAANAARIKDTVRNAAQAGADLVVLPECILSGYMYESREEAAAHAVALDSAEVQSIAEVCNEVGIHSVLGLLELDSDGQVFNTAVLIDDQGHLAGHYRKAHLPCLGVDRFVTAGAEVPPVVDTRLGRIGLAICYDLRFPETARLLALGGADLIAQPSTWPYEAEMLAEHFVPVRACENRVYVAVANRADEERGARFMGRSQIAAPSGERMCEAGTDGEELLTARVDFASAREKRIVNRPGVYEVSLFKDRRPELYAAIVDRAGIVRS